MRGCEFCFKEPSRIAQLKRGAFTNWKYTLICILSLKYNVPGTIISTSDGNWLVLDWRHGPGSFLEMFLDLFLQGGDEICKQSEFRLFTRKHQWKNWISIVPLPSSIPRIFQFRGLKMKPSRTSRAFLPISTDKVQKTCSTYKCKVKIQYFFQLYGQPKYFSKFIYNIIFF